jgi:hypothetical protein
MNIRSALRLLIFLTRFTALFGISIISLSPAYFMMGCLIISTSLPYLFKYLSKFNVK